MNVKRNENRDAFSQNITYEQGQSAYKNSSHSKKTGREDEEAAMQLRESEERFRLMFEQASVGMAFASLQGQLVQVNQGYCDITGYAKEYLLNHSLIDITHPDDVEKNVDVFQHLLKSETQVSPIEKRYMRPDGSFTWANVSISLIRNAQGVPLYYMAVVIDISERKRIEAERDFISQQEQASRQQASRLEYRTQTSLEGLLTIAQTLVQLPGYSTNADEMHAVGQRLAELTRDILDCQRVGLFVVVAETEKLQPLNVIGLSPEQEEAWWQEPQTNVFQMSAPKMLERLQQDEVLVLDMTVPPFNTMPNPYASKTILIAPMRLGERIIGLLMLDYGAVEHVYTESEIALASAIGTLSALVIERQRLLTEQTEARGREVALQEANRRMEEFLGIASHELRTPLTTIKANVQLAKRRLHAATSEPIPAAAASKIDAAQEMLSRAERQVGVLNRLVGDLIDISRIQTGKLQLHLRKGQSDLVDTVTETVQEQRKTTPNRTITLSLPPDEDAILVIADSDRISQVLTNYMTNALKYSASDKPVAVQVMREKGSAGEDIVYVSVRDEGPGLSLGERERIWECFYQSGEVKVVSGSGVGLGLGLYISQTIIERHHGCIGVDSTPGVGSTFWFTLPLVQNDFIAVEEE